MTHIACTVGLDLHDQSSPSSNPRLNIDACLAMRLIVLRGNVHYWDLKTRSLHYQTKSAPLCVKKLLKDNLGS